MYEYLPIEQANPGDIVEYQGTSLKFINESRLHIVNREGYYDGVLDLIDKSGDNTWDVVHRGKQLWKLVKTKPGQEAKIGDKVISVSPFEQCSSSIPIGSVYTVERIVYSNAIDIGKVGYYTHGQFKVLCKSDTKTTTNRKYKVGDVLDISPVFNWYRELVTITEITDTKYFYSYGTNTSSCVHSFLNEYPGNLKINTQTADTNTEADYCQSIQTHQTTKEKTMNPDIKIEVNGQSIDLCKHETAACLKPKTDLESALPVSAVIYTADEAYEKTLYFKSRKKAKKATNKYLQRPNNLGKTIVLHERYGSKSTSVPIIEGK